MIDPRIIQTQVSAISVVGKAVEGWESNVSAACVWVQPSQESSNLTEVDRQGAE
jgi:hypothetical protein